MSALADAAAILASRGIPVFPCLASKAPATERGLYAASTDPEQVRRMFASPAAVLIGMPTGATTGLYAVDVDIKHGAKGDEWLQANSHRLPQTRTHKTQSGGLHLLFTVPAGAKIRNSQSKIAPGVDVRGDGGFVIVPGSPEYAVADDSDPAEMPAWLLELLKPAPAPTPQPMAPRPRADDSHGTPYGMRALDAECAAVCNAPFGQQEGTLNEAGLKLGALSAGGELDPSYARSSLIRAALAMPSQGGREPWTPQDVQKKAERAFEDGMRKPRQAPPREVRHTIRVEIVPPEPPPYAEPPDYWQAEVDPEPAEQRNAAEHSAQSAEAPARPVPHLTTPEPFPTLSLDDLEALQPPEWLIDKLIPVDAFALLVGPYASLKSFLALDLSLCVAYGIPWQGRPVKQGPVLYIAGEGAAGMASRVKAWRRVHGVEDQEAPFRLLRARLNILDPGHIGRLVATAAHDFKGEPVRLAVNDTLARSMVGADENSAQDMGRAVAATDEIRDELKCTTLTVHHMGKDKDRGARGSIALPAAADTTLVVEREGSRLTITVEKQKDAEEGEPIVLEAKKFGTDGDPNPTEDAPTSLVLCSSDEGAHPLKATERRLSGDQQQALRVLHDAIAENGAPDFPGVPRGLPSIPEDWWRDRFHERCKPGADKDTKRKAYRRAADALMQAGLVACNRGRVWAV